LRESRFALLCLIEMRIKLERTTEEVETSPTFQSHSGKKNGNGSQACNSNPLKYIVKHTFFSDFLISVVYNPVLRENIVLPNPFKSLMLKLVHRKFTAKFTFRTVKLKTGIRNRSSLLPY
jgi:hypothetical protein